MGIKGVMEYTYLIHMAINFTVYISKYISYIILYQISYIGYKIKKCTVIGLYIRWQINCSNVCY